MNSATTVPLQCFFTLLRCRMLKRIIISLFFIGYSLTVSAQVKEFDRLEMYFSQRHFKRVYRKANLLLDKPEYDYSLMPEYYKSISVFELAQNEFWLKRHRELLDEAESLFLAVKYDADGEKLFNAHMYEIAWLRDDMATWLSDLKRMKSPDYDRVRKLIDRIFNGIEPIDIPGETDDTDKYTETDVVEISTEREAVVAHAKEQLGVPYVWAGDTPSGFDCSGFTSYILKQSGVDLPRRSSDQYDQSNKIKKRDVQKGDLVFFNNGSGVSHVGIIISEKGEPLVMIHSSSSKGIIITEIEKSEYWLNRLHGFGGYLH